MHDPHEKLNNRRRGAFAVPGYLAALPVVALCVFFFGHTAFPRFGQQSGIPDGVPVGSLVQTGEAREQRFVLVTGAGLWAAAAPGRPYVPAAAIPAGLKSALLYQEDRAFYSHHGYSAREIYIVLRDALLSGHRLRGASTLTQQLARTLFLSSERSLKRKLLEFHLALVLEARLPKERILELYVNHVYWGGESRGAAEAARAFFRTGAADPFAGLGPREFAFLVALLPNPNACAPARRPGIDHCRNGGLLRRMTRIIRHSGARGGTQSRAD